MVGLGQRGGTGNISPHATGGVPPIQCFQIAFRSISLKSGRVEERVNRGHPRKRDVARKLNVEHVRLIKQITLICYIYLYNYPLLYCLKNCRYESDAILLCATYYLSTYKDVATSGLLTYRHFTTQSLFRRSLTRYFCSNLSTPLVLHFVAQTHT